MGRRKEAYLVRGGDGRMRTIWGFSHRGVMREFIRRYDPAKGDKVSVKVRNRGDWQHFDIY